MHVEQYGKGRRTYFAIHGWAGDHRDFAPLASYLPGDARLLSVDLPGYGASPPPSRWDLDAIVEELLAEIERAGPDPVTLMGFCSGAVYAALVARRAPARVARMVLIDPFAYAPWYFRIFLVGAFGRRAYRSAFVSPAGRRIGNWFLRRRQATDADFMVAFETVDHDVTLHHLRMIAPLRFGEFRGMKVPVDIAQGRHTFEVVRRSTRLLCGLWPGARIHELRHVGHLPLVRGAAQLAEIIFVP